MDRSRAARVRRPHPLLPARRIARTLTPRSEGVTLCAIGQHAQSSRTASPRRMSIRDVIAMINQMEADGIFDRYAIGGAVGATFYLEPVATLDVDVFVAFRTEPGQLIATPKAIFEYLTARGSSMKGDYVIIAGWPVQFLPPTGPLVEEALAEATGADVDGMPARVF